MVHEGPVPFPTNGSTAVVENGLIYLVGGFNAASGDLTTALSYNPATNAWTTEASLKLAKSNSAAALLGSTIVSAGGLTNPSVTTSDTEGYNPATNSWSSLAPIPTARQVGCFGVLGQLLYVAGGTSSGSVESPVNVMEAYTPQAMLGQPGFPRCPPLWWLPVQRPSAGPCIALGARIRPRS
jgi:N-acetylneuraminic acid mutarotase